LIISEYLGRLIDCVFAWGGDIENLYGDAILAFWPETASDPAAAMRLALGCAADIVGRHDNHVAPGGVALRIRVAAVAGDLSAVQTGGGGGGGIVSGYSCGASTASARFRRCSGSPSPGRSAPPARSAPRCRSSPRSPRR